MLFRFFVMFPTVGYYCSAPGFIKAGMGAAGSPSSVASLVSLGKRCILRLYYVKSLCKVAEDGCKISLQPSLSELITPSSLTFPSSMMCSSPWGALVALCWIYSTMSVTLCPVPLNTVLRCSFRSCTEQRSPIPWPADSTLASADHTDHTQLSSLPQGLPACSCSALLWGLQVSFLQSSFLAICPQPAGLGCPLQVWDSDSLFLLRPAEIPLSSSPVLQDISCCP